MRPALLLFFASTLSPQTRLHHEQLFPGPGTRITTPQATGLAKEQLPPRCTAMWITLNFCQEPYSPTECKPTGETEQAAIVICVDYTYPKTPESGIAIRQE